MFDNVVLWGLVKGSVYGWVTCLVQGLGKNKKPTLQTKNLEIAILVNVGNQTAC